MIPPPLAQFNLKSLFVEGINVPFNPINAFVADTLVEKSTKQ
jgi:hypothetical protein